VAAEVSGKVELVGFEEGDRVEEGAMLVMLDNALLVKRIEATRAGYEQVVTDLERANKDFGRLESLYSEKFVSEQDFDEARFRVLGLEKRAASLKAELEGLKVELDKKTITAPFAGVIVSRKVSRGEWLSPGSAVATLAGVDVVDVQLDVPENVMHATKKGLGVTVKVAGKKLRGKVYAVIPRGEVSTRTFPIKIRIKNAQKLAEGMEAHVSLPTALPKKALIVHRDALITKFGQTVVFVAADGKAKMLPIEVVGYSGKNVGIKAATLKKGMKVVIKGNERVRDGQPIMAGPSKK
jgi:RND family efflux transporter MFP subunit